MNNELTILKHQKFKIVRNFIAARKIKNILGAKSGIHLIEGCDSGGGRKLKQQNQVGGSQGDRL